MDESIELKAVHKFHHKWSKKKIMVNVTLEMPEEIWEQELKLWEEDVQKEMLNLIKGEKS